MMKVLHVIPSVSERSGGPGQAIIPMCRALQGLGVEITLATTDDGISESSPNYKGIPTQFFKVQWGESFKYSRPLATWLEQNVRNFDLVHIHAVFNHACVAAARACQKHDVPYIVRPLGTLDPWSMRQKALKKSIFWQLSARSALRQAAAVQYTSRTEKEASEQHLRLNHGRVVPLGIDWDSFQNSRNDYLDSAFREMLDRPFVLVLSRLVPTKGLDPLLDAFLNLRTRGEFPEWRLILAGEGPPAYVQSLERKVTPKGAQDAVVFPGWVSNDQKISLLHRAALLALPSHHENFGLCVMEALAFSVPVLVSNQVNLADEIEAAGAGWITEVNSSSLETTLALALGDATERTRRGRAGQLLAQQYSWPIVAKRLTDLYSEILNKTETKAGG